MGFCRRDADPWFGRLCMAGANLAGNVNATYSDYDIYTTGVGVRPFSLLALGVETRLADYAGLITRKAVFEISSIKELSDGHWSPKCSDLTWAVTCPAITYCPTDIAVAPGNATDATECFSFNAVNFLVGN